MVETEYRAMAKLTKELVWLKQLLDELGFQLDAPMHLRCDNQVAIYIATNPCEN